MFGIFLLVATTIMAVAAITAVAVSICYWLGDPDE